MTVYLCEKPSQAKDIAKQLNASKRQHGYFEGKGVQVTWCVGHLLELASPAHYRSDETPWQLSKLPLVPTTWRRVVSRKTRSQFQVIQTLLTQAKHVVIATDADREGEVIARELLEQCGYSGSIERLWLSALDDASIRRALSQLKSGQETESLYQAGLGRQRADWLIGMNLTMAVSSLYGVNSILSVGRVQTPTLQLIAERDQLIEHFVPQDYFVLKAQFTKDQHVFWATWQAPASAMDEQGRCTSRVVIEDIASLIEDEEGVVSSFNDTPKQQKAPLCLSLSVLQKIASQRWGYSAKQTLQIAQALYETHKAITYPRTDSQHLPVDQHADVPGVLASLAKIDTALQPLIDQCDNAFISSVWNDKKVTAHHAMIPTTNDQVVVSQMTTEELNVYDIIRRHYLAQFLGDYTYVQRHVLIRCGGQQFQASTNIPTLLGWKQVFGAATDEEDDALAIPVLAVGDVLDQQALDIQEKQTQPPTRYTDGSLIDAMKSVGKRVEDDVLKRQLNTSQGIGTEATRANIIDTLINRGYVKRQKKQLISTEKGRALLQVVPSQMKDPLLTARWEKALDDIANGQETLSNFMSQQVTLLKSLLDELHQQSKSVTASHLQLQSETRNHTVYLCPQCQSPLRQLTNQKKKRFWGCSGYPACSFTALDRHNQPVESAHASS